MNGSSLFRVFSSRWKGVFPLADFVRRSSQLLTKFILQVYEKKYMHFGFCIGNRKEMPWKI